MSKFVIHGGKRLSGELKVQGAKNSVLPLLAATLLVEGQTILKNCPNISDVDTALNILNHLGCKTKREEDVITVDSSQLTCNDIPDLLMGEMRSSVMFFGPMLARYGAIELTYPGGCEIGSRPIDLHLIALGELGVKVEENGDRVSCKNENLVGKDIYLSFPSVGATENIMLLASACKGRTRIINAAREPEIEDLQKFLNALGMRVSGAGGMVITIEGSVEEKRVEHTVMSDRIVAQTYLTAAAITKGEITLTNACELDMMAGIKILEEAGCTLTIDATGNRIKLLAPSRLHSVRPIKTEPHPAFATDTQAIYMSAMSIAQGTTVFVENVFENRFGHTEGLRRMGADMNILGKVCVVSGVGELHGATVKSPDLRGGAALTLAGLAAEGTTIVENIYHIDRGYEPMEVVLSKLGAQIERI